MADSEENKLTSTFDCERVATYLEYMVQSEDKEKRDIAAYMICEELYAGNHDLPEGVPKDVTVH